MEITEEVIKKFFLQQCSPEERLAVGTYFDEHPEELDKYLDDASWVKFGSAKELNKALSDDMLLHIEAGIVPEPFPIKHIRQFNYGKWMAAASIVLVLGASILYWVSKSGERAAPPATIAVTKIQSVISVNDTIYNRTTRVNSITLADGSLVTLSPASRIIYHRAFIQPQRDVYLSGEAVFKVAKDKTRPFTVYACNLSTTALGTRFKVTAFEGGAKVRVMLYTGKVVIRQLEKRVSDVYLKPGQQLVFNHNDRSVQVGSFASGDITKANAIDPTKPAIANVNIIDFKNQPLLQVVAAFQRGYQITIEADETVLANRYYTGQVNLLTDKPEDVLNTIATLNRLKLTRQKDGYALTR